MDISVLNSLRELGTLRREFDRLRIVRDVGAASGDSDLTFDSNVEARLELVERELERVAALLTSAGIEEVAAP
ncbi:hypothetical protein [Leifsonia xyli]|uniref:hypothetical protein n=1 Tax=Leifsonia xyli TaxID=1575 RepID=UPI003D67E987